MRVFLDTNVLVSAVATRGLCADVVRQVLAAHELVICNQLLAELRRILSDKFGVSEEVIEAFVALIGQEAIYAEPDALPAVDLQDRDDLGILAASLCGRVQVLVTGDQELQQLGAFSGIQILSPRKFWEQWITPPETDRDA